MSASTTKYLNDNKLENMKMGEYHIAGVGATKLSQEFGTPLFVYDEQKIVDNIRLLNNAFSIYPHFKIHVAIKSNNNLALLKVVKNNGCSADCSNINEIGIARMAGFHFENMIYSGNYQSIDDLKFALENRVIINLDNADDLPRLVKLGIPHILSFRLNPRFGNGSHSHVITAGSNAKFGIDQKKIYEVYAQAKNAGVTRFGLHVMSGSGIMDAKYFAKIARLMIDVAGMLKSRLGIDLEFIDIGGGFGIPYKPGEKALDINKVAASVVKEINDGIIRYKLETPKLIIEPGRYIFGNSGFLLAKIVSIKFGRPKYLGLDAGMNTLVRPALYGAYHHFVLARDEHAKPVEKVNFCGQICENSDIFVRNLRFPPTRIDDIIVIKDVGAYGFVMSSQYNAQPRAAEVLITHCKPRIIRKREDINDIIDGMLQ
jgi:diaminopimelate decarboxylase